MEDLYTENYKSLIKDIEKGRKTWKNTPCAHGLERST